MKATPARLDANGDAKPLTRLLSHPPRDWCVGFGTMAVEPEYEGDDGVRIPLAPPEPIDDDEMDSVYYGFVEPEDESEEEPISDDFSAEWYTEGRIHRV